MQTDKNHPDAGQASVPENELQVRKVGPMFSGQHLLLLGWALLLLMFFAFVGFAFSFDDEYIALALLIGVSFTVVYGVLLRVYMEFKTRKTALLFLLMLTFADLFLSVLFSNGYADQTELFSFVFIVMFISALDVFRDAVHVDFHRWIDFLKGVLFPPLLLVGLPLAALGGYAFILTFSGFFIAFIFALPTSIPLIYIIYYLRSFLRKKYASARHCVSGAILSTGLILLILILAYDCAQAFAENFAEQLIGF